MKTKSNKIKKSESGLQNRIAQSSTENSQPEPGKNQTEPLIPLDYEKRREYRTLPTESVLSLLRTEAPRFFELAEIVGNWVWIQFEQKQPREVTAALSQLGFHWNNKRQAWQHPCGKFTLSTPRDPRAKYGSRFAADTLAA